MTEQEARELNEIQQLFKRVVKRVADDLRVELERDETERIELRDDVKRIELVCIVRQQLEACIARLDRLTNLPILVKQKHTVS